MPRSPVRSKELRTKGKYDFVDYEKDKWSLRIVGGRAFVNLMLSGEEGLREMYEGNFLTGRALKIAEEKFGGNDEDTRTVSRKDFSW
jgi:hypothetical protein